jgi:hypothetical protein
VGLRLGPASAFAGKDRALVLRIFWDDDERPAIEVPAGDFFGYSFGEPATRSLLLGTSEETNYVYFPMPFDNRARVELVSQATSGSAIEIDAELVFVKIPRDRNEGKLYALWRRESPTTKGKPFAFLSTRGRGHVVAAILQAQGPEPGHTSFFEGDDVAILDGSSRFTEPVRGLLQRRMVRRRRPLGTPGVASDERLSRLQEASGANRAYRLFLPTRSPIAGASISRSSMPRRETVF